MKKILITLLLVTSQEAQAMPNLYSAKQATKTPVYKSVKPIKPITAKKVKQDKVTIKMRGVKVKIKVKF